MEVKMISQSLISLFFMMLNASIISIKIFLLTLILGLTLGLIVAFGRMSKIKVIREPIKIYLLIMRGTPLILQLFFFFYFPFFIFGFTLPHHFICHFHHCTFKNIIHIIYTHSLPYPCPSLPQPLAQFSLILLSNLFLTQPFFS